MERGEDTRIQIRCPNCSKVFEELERPAVHPEAEDEDQEFSREGRTAACPRCREQVALDLLEAGADGIWSLTPDA